MSQNEIFSNKSQEEQEGLRNTEKNKNELKRREKIKKNVSLRFIRVNRLARKSNKYCLF